MEQFQDNHPWQRRSRLKLQPFVSIKCQGNVTFPVTLAQGRFIFSIGLEKLRSVFESGMLRSNFDRKLEKHCRFSVSRSYRTIATKLTLLRKRIFRAIALRKS